MSVRNNGRRALVVSTLLGVAWMFPVADAAGAQTASQERQVAAERSSNQNVDERVEDRVSYRLETDEDTRRYNIDVEVENGVATLSGDVATQAQRAEAVRLAEGVDGVTRIEDKIEIDADADRTLADRTKRGLSKTGDAIDDAWITTKVNWFFVGEDALDGSDINVDTENNIVTLKGTVRSEAGRARAKALAQQTEGVKEVRDQLTVAPAR